MVADAYNFEGYVEEVAKVNYEEMENYVLQLEEENMRLKQSNKSLRTNNKGLLNGLNKISSELLKYRKKYGKLNE